MVCRFAATERVETDPLGAHVDFGADEAMKPLAVDEEGAAKQGHPSIAVGSAKEDDGSGERLLEIQSPATGEAASGGGGLDAGLATLPQGGDIAG